jgi:hypothetical protein
MGRACSINAGDKKREHNCNKEICRKRLLARTGRRWYIILELILKKLCGWNSYGSRHGPQAVF